MVEQVGRGGVGWGGESHRVLGHRLHVAICKKLDSSESPVGGTVQWHGGPT